MGEFHHDIGQEFPEFRDRIHDLKTGNAHFARLFDKQIARIEQEIEPTTDEHAEELKRQRVKLKDEIFGMLRAS